MIYGIILILIGILAVPSLILSKKPEAKEVLDKIAPYQGWIGVLACIWGVWGLINLFLNISYLTSVPVWWITWAAGAAAQTLLGFLLGYGLIAKFALSKNDEAKEKGEQLLAKLQPWQGRIGLLSIGLGIWWVVASLILL